MVRFKFSNGNVAIDVARVLTANLDALARTDVNEDSIQRLKERRIKNVI